MIGSAVQQFLQGSRVTDHAIPSV